MQKEVLEKIEREASFKWMCDCQCSEESLCPLSLCSVWLLPSSSSLALSEQDKGATEKSTLTRQRHRQRTRGCWETEWFESSKKWPWTPERFFFVRLKVFATIGVSPTQKSPQQKCFISHFFVPLGANNKKQISFFYRPHSLSVIKRYFWTYVQFSFCRNG